MNKERIYTYMGKDIRLLRREQLLDVLQEAIQKIEELEKQSDRYLSWSLGEEAL